MFKQIISQLSFSPSTVEAIGRYAKKLRKQQHIAGWASLMLLILSILQTLVTVFPSSPSSFTTVNDLIPGGASSRETLLSAADTNTNGFMSAANLWNITRSDIAASHECANPPFTGYTTGKAAYRTNTDEQQYTLPDGTSIYLHASAPLTNTEGWCGTTSTGSPFIIAKSDGNITTPQLPAMPASSRALSFSHVVSTPSTAPIRAGEAVSWELTATNPGNTPVRETITFDLRDISEYVHITSVSQDGIISDEDHQITWPDVTVGSHGQQSFTVTGYVAAPIDETASQSHNPFSRDCQLTTSFGNVIDIPLACSPLKQFELIAAHLPLLSNYLALTIFGALTVISLCFYLTLRLRAKEIRIIRSQLNTGGL